MDYEDKYKKALKEARAWYGQLRETGRNDYANELEHIFEELKECEGERMRKAIICLLQEFYEQTSAFYKGESVKDMLAWLEKQGNSKFEQCIQDGDNIVTNEDGTHFNVSQLERTANKVTESKETAKEFLKTDRIIGKNGEQLAEEYMQEKSSKFHIGDTVKIHCYGRPKHIQNIYNNKLGNIHCIWNLDKNHWGNIGVILENGCNNLFFESELEIVAKKEPEFKVEEGKWYVCISQFCNCVEGRVYKATSNSRIMDDFGTEYDMHSDAFKYFRLWTINDARKGDVLVHNNCTFIFMGIKDGIVQAIEENMLEPVNFGEPDKDNDYHPATKEQCDCLFQKMKEAGYEWNKDTLELKQI